MIDIFYTNFQEKFSNDLWNKYLKKIPEEIQKKIIRFKRWQDRQSALLGKILLIEALKKSGYQPECLSNLSYTKHNRPFLNDSIDFNISHSGEYVLCAISSTSRVGIDVERIRPIELNDFENYMTADQWKSIKSSRKPFEKFYEFWTIKESVLKVDGRGLSIPLKDIHTDGGKVMAENNIWHVKKIDLHSEYSCHVATDLNQAEIKLTPCLTQA